MAAKTREDIKKSFNDITVPSGNSLKDFADSVLFLKDEGCVSVWKKDTFYAAKTAVFYDKNFYALTATNTPYCSAVSPDKDSKNWCKIGNGEDEDWFINGSCMYANTDILRVGIGTTTPDATLDVSRKGKGQFLVEPNATDPKVSLINLDPNCDKNKVEIIAATQTIDIQTDAPDGIRILKKDGEEKSENYHEIARFRTNSDNQPRVGIGTTMPDAHLHAQRDKHFIVLNLPEGAMPEVKVGNLDNACDVNFVSMTLGKSEAAFVTDGYDF
jgi:hypothetical protein